MTLSLPAALQVGFFVLFLFVCLSDRIALALRRWQGRRAYRQGYLQEIKDTKSTKTSIRAVTARDYSIGTSYRVH